MAIRKSSGKPAPRAIDDYPLPEFVEISHEEAWRRFDARALELLGISGDEFTQRWDRGDYDEGPEDRRVIDVWFAMISRPATLPGG